MPHNLPKKAKISHVQVSPMSARPKLAVCVAKIMAGWSRVEQRLGFILIELLGQHAHTGIMMYKALSGSASQMAVFRAVARDRLTSTMMDELEGLLRRFKRVAQKRNEVIHGLWSVSDHLPDALVWCGSADDLLAQSEFWAGWASHRSLPDKMDWMHEEWSQSYPRSLVYEERDFENILAEMQSLLDALASFHLRCKPIGNPPNNEPT